MCGAVVRNSSYVGYESEAMCRRCEREYWHEADND
jgi:hypothetical protein